MSDKNATEVVLADAEGIAKAARILEAGGLVAVPTETVYGLAARADSSEAVAKIYAAKGRPQYNPLIVHVRDLDQARRYGEFPLYAVHIAATEWPGPITLVVPRRGETPLAPAISAGLATIALRAPRHRVMQALLQAVDFPIAAPSANRSGFISPTTAQHVITSLDGCVDLVLDDGRPCEEGIESTILVVREDDSWEELRKGPYDPKWLNLLYHGEDRLDEAPPDLIEAPGQLASHYSPGKPMRLNAEDARQDEFFIGFGEGGSDYNLSPTRSLTEAAARVYDALHKAAASSQPYIAVSHIPDKGIGRAINDRLRRAATPPD